MFIIRKYSTIVILTLTILIGIFNNIPSYTQEDNQIQEKEKADATKLAHSSEDNEHNKTSIVRDSVTILLQDAIIPGTDFLHLYDSTPSHITNGHVALKVPCAADSNSTIQVLIGSAPNMTATTLENIAPLSTPGEQCLYHADLIPGGNVTIITDIALKNPAEEDMEFPPTASVVIGINEITKGEHGHSESEEEHAATEAGQTE